jgi:hypothetical protein
MLELDNNNKYQLFPRQNNYMKKQLNLLQKIIFILECKVAMELNFIKINKYILAMEKSQIELC